MPNSITPYALLRASIPREPAALVTDYDLYSAAQQPGAATPFAAPAVPAPSAPPVMSPEPQAPTPTRRTHYIRDIEARHSAALRRAMLR